MSFLQFLRVFPNLCSSPAAVHGCRWFQLYSLLNSHCVNGVLENFKDVPAGFKKFQEVSGTFQRASRGSRGVLGASASFTKFQGRSRCFQWVQGWSLKMGSMKSRDVLGEFMVFHGRSSVLYVVLGGFRRFWKRFEIPLKPPWTPLKHTWKELFINLDFWYFFSKILHSLWTVPNLLQSTQKHSETTSKPL